MTTQENVAQRKRSLLELAEQLGNVSKACKLMGYSRQQFYEIRRNYQTFGSEGLIDRLPGPRGPHPNRVPDEVEKAILAYCLDDPTHGCLRVAQELALREVQVSSGGVRGVWSRHQWPLRLEKASQKKDFALTEDQVRLLAAPQPRVPGTAHKDPVYQGSAGGGPLHGRYPQGVGRVCLQTVTNCHSRYPWGRLYTCKTPLTAVHALDHDVLPFFERHKMKVQTILSYNGREYCGRPDQHPYELYPQLERIEHRKTPGATPPEQRVRGAHAPDAAQRALPDRRTPYLVRRSIRHVEGPRSLPQTLQREATPPG